MKQATKMRVEAILENVPLAMKCVAEHAQAAGLDDRAVYQIELVVDEACANVVDHAYKGLARGDMEISCSVDEDAFTIRVRDWGKGFDPANISKPDVHAPLEERPLGGLGLFFMRQFMDEVQYTIDAEQGNELVMIKRLKGVG
jgi:anti-sigma regulatory factor (Ser/Thr protein kinase)